MTSSTPSPTAVSTAVADAGIVCATGFNYRNFPAVARAREVITTGAIGRITHARVWLLTDYAAHPGGPLSWRYTLEKGGHGVLGDLASHGADMARYLLGDIERLVAVTDTFIPQRPLAQAGVSHYAVGSADGPTGPVENEDYVVALARLASGVPLTLESSRAAVGDQNNYGFEVHGTQGLVRWDFRRSDELSLSVGDEYSNQPTSTVFAGPGDGDYGALTVQVALRARVEHLMTLPPGAFRPPPKVTSALVRLTFHPPVAEVGSLSTFERVVRGVFLQRRKTILNALLWVTKVEVPEAGVASTVSEEDLGQNLDPKPAPKKK